jgi:ATP-dependent helicase HrpB
LESLEHTPNLVLKAAPGSGKTTRVPPALLKAAFAQKHALGEIIVLEPRRLAAKYSARRVAEEMGEEIGKTVGYQFRFENVGGPTTRLRFMTEGMLMRKLLGDPKLSRVCAVLLDEFHERHLHTDTALAYLRQLQKMERPDLRIVVMSATLDTDRISTYLGEAPVIEVQNRPYDVSVHYLSTSTSGTSNPKPLELQVRDAVVRAIETKSDDEGDILVFLPGMGEIRRAETAIQEYFRGEPGAPLILPLHGELSKAEQDQAIRKADRRKIILSTNVAETSLTIEGVTHVIDSGLHRIATYSWWSGVPSLKTKPISRASAIQRAGRAGRTAPGRCFRLYTQGDFDSRPPFETPEIQRADLSQTLLELKAMGLFDRETIEWFEAPASTALEASWKLLHRLGAIESALPSGTLTEMGRQMARFPAHPRLARFLLESARQNCLDEAATLASWISEGRLERLDAVDCLKLPMSDTQRKLKQQLIQAAKEAQVASKPLSENTEERLRFSLLTGFPDRVSKRRKASASSARSQSGETELVFASGGSAKIEESATTLSSEYFVTLDLREIQHLGQARSKLQVSSLSPIQMEWLIELSPSPLEDREVFTWDQDRSRVMQSSQLVYDELVLEEKSKPATPGSASARILFRSVLGIDASKLQELSVQDWIRALSTVADPEKLEGAFARALLLKKHFPKMAEAFEPEKGFGAIAGIFETRISLAELREADWPTEILGALVPDALAHLDRWLPESIALPSGRRARIYYALDKAPWVESRLQDFFGMRQGPALLEGRLPLTLHLLAPNQRAVQVTTDLAGFWERGYREQRNALSRRYPRHAWPEDPLKPVK